MGTSSSKLVHWRVEKALRIDESQIEVYDGNGRKKVLKIKVWISDDGSTKIKTSFICKDVGGLVLFR